MVLSVDKVSKSFGEAVVIKNITCSVQENDRIGIVGPNGGGKSTLLNLLTENLIPTEGKITKGNGCVVGYLRQNSGLTAGRTIGEEMLSVFRPVLEAKKEMDEITHRLKGGHDEKLTARYADLLTFFEAREGYTIDVKIDTVLRGMGFGTVHRDTVVDTLSGGEKTRLAIAKLLLEAPDLLLLDEPTNHLDFSTLQWLEEYLSSYKGALVVVSHDRFFLDRCIKQIWEIENHQLTVYKGNYSAYLPQKEERLRRAEKEYAAQQVEIEKMEDYVRKNIARASTSASAKSRVKALERMDRLEKPFDYRAEAKLSFTYGREPVKDVLDVQGLHLCVGDTDERRTLVSDLSFHVLRGEKLAIIGGNGTGKTTLLKAIQRQISMPQGRIRWGDHVRIGYFRQEGEHLSPMHTVMEELWSRYPSMTQGEVRSVLARVLIRGEEVFKRVADLSGGERAKLSFAILMLQEPNVLVLDEPTNHLDLISKEVLESAMAEYTGTMIFVSHDRFLLSKIPTSLLILENGAAVRFEGNYSDYLQRFIPPVTAGQEPEKAEKKSQTFRSGKEDRKLRARLRLEVKALEDEIASLEEEIPCLENQLTLPEVYGDYEKSAELCLLLETQKKRLESAIDQWSEKSELLESTESVPGTE